MADRAELTESALDALAEGLALADGESRVLFWNGAAETITGYPEQRRWAIGCARS